jgi:hypothetical protein
MDWSVIVSLWLSVSMVVTVILLPIAMIACSFFENTLKDKEGYVLLVVTITGMITGYFIVPLL